MTRPELINRLEEDQSLREEIVKGMQFYEEGAKITYGSVTTKYISRFERLIQYINHETSTLAKMYLAKYFLDLVSGGHNGTLGVTDRRGLRETLEQFDTTIVDNMYEIHKNISDDALKKLVSVAGFRKERDRRNDLKFDENAKTVKLDLFSFQIFKKYITSKERKLTGKDCTKYLNLIPKWETSKESLIRAKYLKLLWDNTSTKSLAFIDALRWERYDSNVPDNEKPFITLDRHKSPKNTPDVQHIDILYTYVHSIARAASIPLLTDSYYITESSLYKYVTGVPRKTPMSSKDVVFAMDKLLILEFQRLNNPECNYYNIAIEDIKAELSKPANAQLLKEQFKQTNILAAQQTAEDIVVDLISKFDKSQEKLKEKENE